jgi:hypothetical protein
LCTKIHTTHRRPEVIYLQIVLFRDKFYRYYGYLHSICEEQQKAGGRNNWQITGHRHIGTAMADFWKCYAPYFVPYLAHQYPHSHFVFSCPLMARLNPTHVVRHDDDPIKSVHVIKNQISKFRFPFDFF